MSGFWKRTGLTVGAWILGAACLALWAGQARAEERLALVIGNGAYMRAARLENPVRDARAMAAVLGEAQFRVTAVEDATGPALAEAVESFGRAVAAAGPDTVALVYYAGHAAQLDGLNYLLPVDVPLEGEAALKAASVGVEAILKRLDAAGARARLVILDACRNNPFQPSAAGPRGLAVDGPLAQVRGEGGLTRLDAGIGTLVAFATAPGRTAADGRDGHSPYTAALLSLIREPGLPVEALFRRTRLAVHTASGGEQIPWESSSLTGAFSFFPGPAPEAAQDGLSPAARAALAAGPTRESLRDLGPDEAHALAIHLGTIEVLRLYVEVFPAEPRSLALYALIDGTARETAWVWAVRENTRAAFLAYRTLYPGSPHEAEAARLLLAAPEARPVLAALCPPALPFAPAPKDIKGPKDIRGIQAPEPVRQRRAAPAAKEKAAEKAAKPAVKPVARPAAREPIAEPVVVARPLPRPLAQGRPVPRAEAPRPVRRPPIVAVDEPDEVVAPSPRRVRPEPVVVRPSRPRPPAARYVDEDDAAPRPGRPVEREPHVVRMGPAMIPGLGLGLGRREGGSYEAPLRRPGGEGQRAPFGFGGSRGGGGGIGFGPARMF